ncbi:MAG TPA: ABC transporter permease [Candidatus Angelobacter sp.]|jgi:predicted permease|nr:ABC transporter permease [Candidatus Angelobacter sp.]
MGLRLPHDLIFAVRQFRRNPGFTVTLVLTLALGIGATTAIFGLIDGILLRPLPFPHAGQLMAVTTLEFPPGVSPENVAAANGTGTSYPDFFDWQRHNHTFESLASCDLVPRLFSKNRGENARVAIAARVSSNLFSTLGVVPALGRAFAKDEEQPGHRVVILSHEVWVSDFASSPDVIGQTVKISDEPSTIVGVMPSGFHYPIDGPADFWTTFAADNEGPSPNTARRAANRLNIVGRLKPGTNIHQAVSDMNAIQRGLAQQYSENRYRLGVSITPLLEAVVSDLRPTLALLFAAVGIVLIIGCANVAGLLLARASSRQPEMALRVALGASRARILRQLLTEALLFALAGGAVGIPLSFALLRIGLRFIPDNLPRLYDVGMDARVLGFAIALSALTTLFFGLLPSWKASRQDPATALTDRTFAVTSGRHRNRLHHVLVVAETALGFSLLIGSGLLIRSLINILVIDPGFDTKHTLAFNIALTEKRYPGASKIPFFNKLLPKLAALPGVERASGGHPLPFHGSQFSNFTIPGHPASPDNMPAAISAVAEPGYFETLSIPLLRGRTFTDHDNDSNSAPVAVINQSFALKYFPGEAPIGRFLAPHINPPTESSGQTLTGREIVGIVGDVRTEDPWNPYQPEFFLPYAQDPLHQRPPVVLKVAGNPSAYANEVRRIVATLDPDVPVFDYRAFTNDLSRLASYPRFQAVIVSSFAILALLLAAVGLYAVLSYVVAQRTREFGLRMALGSSRSDVVQLVLRRGLALACIGIVIGLGISAFANRVISHTLFKVAALDRSVFLTVTIVLLLVSIIAALAPALRAASIEPTKALRSH